MKIYPKNNINKIVENKNSIEHGNKNKGTAFKEILNNEIVAKQKEIREENNVLKPVFNNQLLLELQSSHYGEPVKRQAVSMIEELLNSMDRYVNELGNEFLPYSKLSGYIDDILEKKDTLLYFLNNSTTGDDEVLYNLGRNSALLALEEISRYYTRL